MALDRIAVWRGYEAELTSLTILIVGIALYTILVFTFYQNLSLRDAFHTRWGAGRWWGRAVHAIEDTFVFPVMSFLYFAVLAGVLFFLAKSQSTYQIFLLSMAVVGSVRLTSFLSEIASADLAKLLPLSLLGVLVVDPQYSTWTAVWARYQEIPGLLPILGRFFLLFLVVETGLRLVRYGARRMGAALGRRPKRAPVPVASPGEALDTIHDGGPTTTLEIVAPGKPAR
ncbi:MAG TPA: hypothetical protein VM370_09060 [Candidatus Thermoplasmatota archaeon]|nr:hypothetical protein [Candidatus Thermoplasmatota archaeon]